MSFLKYLNSILSASGLLNKKRVVVSKIDPKLHGFHKTNQHNWNIDGNYYTAATRKQACRKAGIPYNPAIRAQRQSVIN